MDPLKVLKYQILIFKAFGLWSNKRTIWNRLHLLFAFYFISIGFILTIITSLLFVNSMKQVVDHLIVLNSTVLAFLKGLVFYFKYTKHMQFFEIIEKLNKEINFQSNTESTIMKTAKKFIDILSYGFAVCYLFAWISLAIQSSFSGGEQMFWTSTAFYPGNISQNRIIYWIIFMFQGFANLVLVIATFACDTYGIIVIMMLNGYIDVLSSRLKSLGSDKMQLDADGTSPRSSQIIDASFELVECVKIFYTCLK